MSEFFKKITTYVISPILLAAYAALCYYPSLHYPFQFDDLANIVKNFSVRSGTFSFYFLTGTRWISNWLNSLYYSWGQYKPFNYRVGNIAAHIIAGILLYYVIMLLCVRQKHDSFLFRNRFIIATVTAGLFLLHPVQTQTVSYIIQGQLEGLAALCTLSMLFFFLLYTQAQTTMAKIIYLLALYSCALVISGTKEIGIISPLLVLMVDWFFVAQGDWHLLKNRWLVHVGIFVAVFGMYLYYLKPSYFTQILGLKMELHNNMGNQLTDKVQHKITPLWYCMSEFKVILHYIAIFFWPFTISVDYDWKLVDGFWSFDCFVPLIMLLFLVCCLLIRLRRKSTDVIAFCCLWFLIAVLPRSSIVPGTELLADYKTYLASVGIFLLCALGVAFAIRYLSEKIKAPSLLVALVVVPVILIPTGYGLYQRNLVWSSAELFWENILQNAPGKARAYNNYGVSLCEAGKNEQAIPLFLKAISLDAVYSDPYNNVAVAYGALLRYDDGIEALKKSIAIHPLQPEAYNNMASFYIEKKEYEKAQELLKKALRLRPHYGKAHFNLGRVLQALDQKEDAWRHFKACCMQADFDTEFGFAAYAQSSMQLKKYDDALFAYKKLIELSPANTSSVLEYANCCMLAERPQQALPYYQMLLRNSPDNVTYQFLYAEALSKIGDHHQALPMYDKVLIAQPGFVVAYIKKARTLVQLNRKREGVALLNNLLKNNMPHEIALIVRQELAAL